MKKQAFFTALLLIMTWLSGCKNEKAVKPSVSECDTVAMATINLCDTVDYSILNDVNSHISANVEITYPKTYVNNENTDALQKIYAKSVLNVSSDSSSLASAFSHYVDNLVNRYVYNTYDLSDEEILSDYEPIVDCKLRVKIYPVYNADGLLSVCKEETSIIDDKTPEKRHFYYVINLLKMDKVEIYDIFSDESLTHVAELLKNKLRKDLNVANDDEFADLGYYNFDNLSVSENFYITADSIVWNYSPRELSVLNEVKISLSRNEIDY